MYEGKRYQNTHKTHFYTWHGRLHLKNYLQDFDYRKAVWCPFVQSLGVCLLVLLLDVPCSVHRLPGTGQIHYSLRLCLLTAFTRWDLIYLFFSNSLLKHKAMLLFINLINLLINLESCFNALALPSVSVHNNFKSICTRPLWADRQKGLMSTLQMVSWVTETWKSPSIFDAPEASFCGVFNIMLNIIPRVIVNITLKVQLAPILFYWDVVFVSAG